jgi:hypothetical protein
VLGTREKWQAAARSEEDFSQCHSERGGELVRGADREWGFFAALRVTSRGLPKIFVEMRGARGLFKLLDPKT